jgi:PPM family protein phosphatase
MERIAVSHGVVSPVRAARRTFRFDAAAGSDVGAVREHNEDYVFCGHNFVAVADGVGGNVYGEVASQLVIEAIRYLDDRVYTADPGQEVRTAADYANRRLADAIAENPPLSGMATTLTALRLDGSSVVVLNVGDSRAYRLRAGELVQLTHDDSIVQSLIDAGSITEAEGRSHPARSVVLEVLNGEPFSPTVAIEEALSDDRYLVCSDGLTDYVPETEIAALLSGPASASSSCRALVEAALSVGAPDNVSCVVADVRPLDA